MFPEDVEADSPEERRRGYAGALAAAAADADEERLREEAGLDPDAIDAVRDGDASVTLEDAAAVFALDDERTADALLDEVRDHLLLELSTAVLDVATIAADIGRLDPGELQAKIEGRHPMTVAEYATLRHYVERR